MEKKTVPTDFVWDNWCAEWKSRTDPKKRRRRRYTTRIVIPGNPSLPLRILLGTQKGMNGGIDGTELGIDLGMRGHEVRKLFYAGGFTGTLAKEGIDPEEFLQEVYRGILSRNLGTCPFDYKKSSFGHYVHIVIRCILSNYLRRERTRSSRESVTSDGDIPITAFAVNHDTTDFSEMVDRVFTSPVENQKVRSFLSMLYAGNTKKDSLLALNERSDWGHRVLSKIKSAIMDG